MGKAKKGKPKYGPAGSIFSKEAVAFYKAVAHGRNRLNRGLPSRITGLGIGAHKGPEEIAARQALREKAKEQAAARDRRKPQPFSGVAQGTQPFAGAVGPRPEPRGEPRGKPRGKPSPTAGVQAALDKQFGRPTPKEVWDWTVAANRNRLENLPVGDPGNRPGSGGATAPFPGTPQEWLTRAMELEGLDPNDPTLRPLYEEGTRQEGAANKYQGGYSDVNTGGNEAFGPAQIIPATFDAWADPRFRNRYNPVHNLLAMIRGTKNKYGSYEAGARVYARPGGYG